MKGQWVFLAGLGLLGLVGCDGTDLADIAANPSYLKGGCRSMPACNTPLQEFDGTIAYSNGMNSGSAASCAGKGRYGLQYQCVELVMRHFMTKWRLPRLYRNARDLLKAARSSWRGSTVVIENKAGSPPPAPGDMIVWTVGEYGHVALVTAVSADSVEIIEQNACGGNGKQTLPYRGGTVGQYPGWSFRWAPAGWVHALANGCEPAGQIECFNASMFRRCDADDLGRTAWVPDRCLGDASCYDDLEYCAFGCHSTCTPEQEGEVQCSAADSFSSVMICERVGGCWSYVQHACPGSANCRDDLQLCIDGCADVCEEGQHECATTTSHHRCQLQEDGCLDWSEAVECPQGTVCSGGACGCSDSCGPEGQLECAGTFSYDRCEYQDDGCLGWATRDCQPGTVCSGGSCRPTCSDGCGHAGDVECTGALGYRQCETQDDGCLGWTDHDCPPDTVCSAGWCEPTCSDSCPEGDVACSGTATYQRCERQASGCLDWSYHDCSPNTVCSDGSCIPTCTSECTQGQRECATMTSYRACEMQGDGCTDWVSHDCPSGTVCSGGSCIPTCTSECTQGERECVTMTSYRVCEMQSDGCTDWVTHSCSSGVCSGGSC